MCSTFKDGNSTGLSPPVFIDMIRITCVPWLAAAAAEIGPDLLDADELLLWRSGISGKMDSVTVELRHGSSSDRARRGTLLNEELFLGL